MKINQIQELCPMVDSFMTKITFYSMKERAPFINTNVTSDMIKESISEIHKKIYMVKDEMDTNELFRESKEITEKEFKKYVSYTEHEIKVLLSKIPDHIKNERDKDKNKFDWLANRYLINEDKPKKTEYCIRYFYLILLYLYYMINDLKKPKE